MGSALAGAIKEYKDAILKDPALWWVALADFSMTRFDLKSCTSIYVYRLSLSSFSAVFCGANGTLLKENDTVKNLKLAGTYRRISEEGADAFYVGPMAEALVKDIQAKGTDTFIGLYKTAKRV